MALSLLDQARHALQQGDRRVAKALIRQEMLHNPENAEAWILSSLLTDDPVRRREVLERALELDPTNDTAKQALQYILGQSSEPPPPEPSVEIPVPVLPDRIPKTAFNRANLFLGIGVGLIVVLAVVAYVILTN